MTDEQLKTEFAKGIQPQPQPDEMLRAIQQLSKNIAIAGRNIVKAVEELTKETSKNGNC
jgi:hypothetical protein